MAVSAASNAASSAAAASTAVAASAAAAGAIGAVAAGVSTATAIGVTAAVGVAGAVAVGSSMLATSASTKSVVASESGVVGCNPNPVVDQGRLFISFFPSAKLDKAAWETKFKDIYNEVSPQCNERYQRILQNATLDSNSYVNSTTGQSLLTSWGAFVSCSPECPTEPLFGDSVSVANRMLEANSSKPIVSYIDWLRKMDGTFQTLGWGSIMSAYGVSSNGATVWKETITTLHPSTAPSASVHASQRPTLPLQPTQAPTTSSPTFHPSGGPSRTPSESPHMLTCCFPSKSLEGTVHFS